ncbi:RagB/SusD family nutrient uptake outer membrane protein [Flammeovirga agarivorans]|uniref:RagB/SusD family nutrient uptake outer membrane protein n=1 Tax=Flammeovirga agarivorans TaxID=2726742 RepID=A0A7X8SNI2_9BACT|nr:RagB/SusD family nutrient uptake outer membrane protein [Flammeovirga agarivorans]NLR93415.1 RagB/SusD family nutrient uptake outer membrane protein [Flammeovirga agarivorans]
MNLVSKNIFRCIIILVGISALTSCTKDYLTEINPNETTIKDFYQNLDDSEAGLTAVYASMMNHYMWNFGEEACRSDLGYPGMDRPTPTSRLLAYYQHTYTETSDEINKKWAALYNGIFKANQVIHGLQFESMEEYKEEELWGLQMAQARFFRGLFHFYAHQAFNNGEVIIRDSWVDANNMYKAVSPADSVLNFVREDLKYAYEHLPANYNNTAITDVSGSARVTKGSAAMILANSYLFDFVDGANYDSAAYYYNDVIYNSEYGYALETDMSKIFTTAGAFNSESILEIAYSNDVRPDLNNWDEVNGQNRWAAVFSPQSYGGNRQSIPVGWVAYAYKTEQVDPSDARNTVEVEGSSFARNISMRASAMMALAEDDLTPYYQIGSVSEADPFRAGGARSPEFGYYKQFSNYDILDSERSLPMGNQRSAKNVVINRLSEAYLNLAECKIQMGQLNQAINLINEVRSRWGLVLLGSSTDGSKTFDGLSYNATNLMDHIMYVEKPLELSVEGHQIRWIDLRRWGIIKENFQRISSQNYWVVHFKDARTYSQKTLWNSSIIPGGDTHPTPEKEFTARPNYKIVDGESALMNYIPSLHDFYPIPTSELSTNPGVKG